MANGWKVALKKPDLSWIPGLPANALFAISLWDKVLKAE